MKSVMNHSFSKVPTISAPRSSFDRSHAHKTTFDAAELVPFFIDEALPGDTLNLKTAGFARLATPEFPIMDNMYMDTFFFSVPIRQIWENWRKFCGEQVDPSDSIDYTIPTIRTANTAEEGSIYDYMGIPLVANLPVNALPIRAYWHIWNEWFRDQNLQESAQIRLNDQTNSNNGALVTAPVDARNGGTSIHRLAQRGKRHDYFTSCLPWPNKGEEVRLPLGLQAPITGLGLDVNPDQSPTLVQTRSETGGDRTFGASFEVEREHTGAGQAALHVEVDGALNPLIYANLSEATAATINDLRESFQIQKLLEKDARGGTRYAELIKSHFGVNFQDVTYRPEYLGGGSTPIHINPVAETAQDRAGELGAFGTASFNGHGFVKSFTEHCYIIGLVNVRADLTYQQGLNRMWSRETRYDFYWPSLAQIGEQAVLNKEIYAQATIEDDQVFGYNERYSEYRYKPSIITGQFRSSVATSLDVWHLSEEFTALPTLSSSFILDSSPNQIDRAIATPSEPQFIADFWFDYKCARPMPLYGTPGMIDHF